MAMEAQAAIMSKRGTPYPADTRPQTSRANASADSSKNEREPSARALAFAIWQRHPSWQGSPGYSQATHDSCLELVMPEYANLRLHLFADCRVHITNRRYWDATVVASYETSAYHQRRHRPFFNCAADGLTHTQMADRIDRWLGKYGAYYDALVSAESADIEARTRQEQQERASLWVQLLGAIPFNPDAEIQTTHRHSVPKIETAVGKVAISADPDQIELTITLRPSCRSDLDTILADLNSVIEALDALPPESPFANRSPLVEQNDWFNVDGTVTMIAAESSSAAGASYRK